jgi:hypothetical protein
MLSAPGGKEMDSLKILAFSEFQILIRTTTKFYPCFCFGDAVHREARRGEQPRKLSQYKSVFNIIFKKDYLVRYMEVSGQYPEHEARHHG